MSISWLAAPCGLYYFLENTFDDYKGLKDLLRYVWGRLTDFSKTLAVCGATLRVG